MKRFVLLICFLILPFGTLMAQEIRVGAQVDTKKDIYAGDRFGYYVVLEGTNKAGDVDLSGLSGYDPKFVGNRDVSSSSVSIINGRRTEQVSKQFVMTYSLLAKEAGIINLSGVDIKVDGKVFKTNPVSVRVIEPSRSEKLKLEMSVSKQKCYAGEPVEISLKWYISKDAAGSVAVDGVSFLSPVFESEAFHVERIINEPRALNDRDNYLGLELNGEQVPFEKRAVEIDGRDWIELSYSAFFIPKQAGLIDIRRSRVLADFAVGRVVSRGFFGGTQRETKRFMAESKGGELKVKALPDVDRPEEAYGLVGSYTISASVKPTTVDVGQPITLTVKIAGKLLSPVRRPEIEEMDGFAGNFKVSNHLEDPVVRDGQKIFTMTLRAGNDSITEIPAIPLVFFDTDKGGYVTAKSDPIPLKVNPSEILTIGDVEFAGNRGMSSQVEAVKRGIAANVVDIELVSQEFTPISALVSPGYLSLWGVPFAAFIVSVVFRMLTNTSDAKIAASRRRKARRNAEGMLKAAKTKQDAAGAMREYIGWRFGKSSGALTGMDCEKIISESTGDNEIASEYRAMLEKCEAAQYTGGGGVLDNSEVEKIIGLIVLINKKSGY